MAIKKLTFTHTGANQTFIVPPFVQNIFIKAWGAGGAQGQGNSFGGPGGYATGNLAVVTGQTLTIIVGRGGQPKSIATTYGGGGGGGGDTSGNGLHGSSGGGRSAVRLSNGTEVLTAGGGGGSAGATGNPVWSNGGAGGGLVGINGWINNPGNQIAPGVGGTQISGGAGGTYYIQPNGNGFDGYQYQGGQGGTCITINAGAGGGGGGGYFGGGGGSGQYTNVANPHSEDSSGGGGSSYIGGVTDGSTLSTSQNTSQTISGLLNPPNNTDTDYISGVGVGASLANSAGGNGLIVIIYDQPELGMNKSVDDKYSGLNGTLTYTILISNNNNTTIANIRFVDTIPSGTILIPNTFIVDGVINGGTPNPPGITIPQIGPSAVSTIQFKVNTSTSMPSPSRITNISTSSYSGGFVFNSNSVSTTINSAFLLSTKITDKSYSTIGDTITYTIILANSGNVTATNVVFIDTIPNGTSLVNGTFKQDFTNITGSPNPPGVTLPNPIGPNSTSTITFQVLVTTLPTSNPISNNSSVRYSYTFDPSVPNSGVGNCNSNTVNTKINSANLINITKIVDKDFAKIGDVLTYTISFRNTGNTSVVNLIFKDTIPNDTTFVLNSFTVNGVVKNGANPSPPTGVNVGTIPIGATTTLSFKVIVNTIPSPNPIPNNSTLDYAYVIDESTGNLGFNSGNSNLVNTKVNNALVSSQKSCDASNVIVEDTITYTISHTNTGNTTANNMVFIDTIPNGTIFVPNSVIIDGVTLPSATVYPPSGISLPNLGINKSTTLIFTVIATTVPSPNPTANIGSTKFKFIVDPTLGIAVNGACNTNSVSTFISSDTIPIKSVDKAFATVGDTLTYTISWKNILNIDQINLIFIDTIPNDTTFVTDSVTINEVSTPGATIIPPNGLNLGTLPVGQSVTVNFKVTINTIPSPNPITNNVTAIFDYITDPTLGTTLRRSNISNTVNTKVNLARIESLSKHVDKDFAIVGDTLTYTISFRNTGNTSAINLIFKDTIPYDTIFVSNSFTANGVVKSGANPSPPTGVNLGTIPNGSTTTLTFKVTIDTIPSPNPILNSGNITFDYIVDPTVGITDNSSVNSNIVNTKINTAFINSLKSTNIYNAIVGDTIIYTIALQNSGNTTANNIFFIDTIPDGTEFVPNSVTINSLSHPGEDPSPPGGINLGALGVNELVTITFSVTATTVPTPNPTSNNASASFNYIVDPTLSTNANGSSNTNSVSIFISSDTNPIKSVNKTYATVGDTLTYTVVWKNALNVTQNNLVFIDTIPNDTTFVPDSVTINEVPQIGATINPPNGLNLGILPVDESVTVTFKVIVDTIPNPNPICNDMSAIFNYISNPIVGITTSKSNISNKVNTKINLAKIANISKYVDKDFATIGDTLTYTISFVNMGNASATNLIFKDTIPNDTNFIPNSFTVNGVVQNGANPSAPTGVNIGTIPIGVTTTLSFKIVVNTVPSPNPISNSATLDYNYIIDESTGSLGSGSGNTNLANTFINYANLSSIIKTADKNFAKIGDTLTYTIAIKNTGNTNADNVIFADTVVDGTTFVSNSIAVDGVNQIGANPFPPTGVNIGSIPAQSTTTVTFDVTVNHIPSPNPISNSATTNYSYIVDPVLGMTKNGSGNSSVSYTQVNKASIHSLKLVDKATAIIGDTITYTIELMNLGNTTADNLVFIDTIPDGTVFITNSVTINSVSIPGENPAPPTGINLGSLGVNDTISLSFKVIANTVPTPNHTLNSAVINFDYIVDPVLIITTPDSSNSNIVTTFISADAIPIKSVDKDFVTVGDTLTYTISWKNVLNVSQTNLIFVDTIPNDTTFSTNSIKVNGFNHPGATITIPNGLNLGTLPSNQTVTVTFEVVVNTIPSPNPITNNMTVIYTYVSDPTLAIPIRKSNISNPVITQVNLARIQNVSKYVDKDFATVGDNLTYIITLENTGNVPATNFIFKDTLPNDTTYIPNSFTVNNIVQGGANPSHPTGVDIGNVDPGNTITLTFEVAINTIPSPNPIPNSGTLIYDYIIDELSDNFGSGSVNTNIVNTSINFANINSPFKSVDKYFADIGSTLTYTINLKNTGNVSANNVIFRDTIPNDITFIPDSVTVNGVPKIGIYPNVINVGTIPAGQTFSITFKVRVDTIPSPNPILNAGNTIYDYIVDPTLGRTSNGSGNTNIVTTLINHANLNNITKFVDNIFATCGDILTYTINIPNTGSTTALNVFFIDTIPSGTIFVPDSVSINGIPQIGVNPSLGVSIPDIGVFSITTVVFKVEIQC